MSIDPRAHSATKIVPPEPLPFVSRRALARVKDPLPPPTECPYCANGVELVDHEDIYNGKSYGEWPYMYWCRECDARVGLHPQTDIPLGTMADDDLRKARIKAKKAWQGHAESIGLDRRGAYAWLAEKLGIDPSECHFGMFDLGRCRDVEAVIEKQKGGAA